VKLLRNILACLVVLSVVIAGAHLTGIIAPTAVIEQNPRIRANVHVLIERDGKIILSESSHNLLMDIGAEYVEDGLTNSTFINVEGLPTYISLSSNTTAVAATDTQILEEITAGGLERATGTITDNANGNWSVAKEFTATATHVSVQKVGLNWKAGNTDNCLLAQNTFLSTTLGSGDKITVTWTLTVT